jgi:hypothetical protein
MSNALEPSERRLNPLFSFWFKPRATMRQLLHSGYDRWNYLLAAARGLGFAISIPSDQLLPDEWSALARVVALVLAGVLLGMILLPLRAWAITSTSRHFGGSASYREIRGAIAWSGLMGCWWTLAWIGLVGVITLLEIFAPSFVDALYAIHGNSGLSALEMPLVAISIWYIIVEFKCVAEASRFSVWKAWLAEVFGHGLLAVVLLFPAFFALGIWAAVTAQ